ncbi:MAG: SpoIIE family protein phosphatase [Deltaproteobacteria bacterium]|jgi:sigma-B regulation protein RsbU (phosphoserine phosphatase)|nr:SpoIIE family protein phosphatase [Deltaproteobacteria bacterium]
MSFRVKVSLILVAGIILTVFTCSFLAYRDFYQATILTEKQRFRTLASVMNGELRSAYHSYLTGQVLDIVRQKETLRKISFLSARYLEYLYSHNQEPEAANFLAERQAFTQNLDELGVHLAVFPLPSESPLESEPGLDLENILGSSEIFAQDPHFFQDIFNYTGRPLSQLLQSQLIPKNGRFVLLTKENIGGEATNCLGFLLVSDKHNLVFVTLEDLAEIKNRSLVDLNDIVSQLRRRLPQLPIGPGSHAFLLDQKGFILARHGTDPINSKVPVFGEDILLAAQNPEGLETLLTLPPPFGETLARLEWFKALDWYIVLATPSSSLTLPARQMGQKLFFIGFSIGILAILFGLTASHMVTKSLRAMTARAREAGTLDFTSLEAANFFHDTELSKRHDEIGDLSAAFDLMGQDLLTNIQERLEATRIQERVLGELNAAKDIQEGILPKASQAPNTLDFQAVPFLRPAQEVGGDFYDFFRAPCGRECLVIGDVSDKGIPAALFMIMVVALTRRFILSGLDPATALTQLNSQLYERNPNSMFVSILVGLFDPVNLTFTYSNGGHLPPLLISRGKLREVSGIRFDPLVGVFPGINYRLQETTFAPGEVCLLYTDGVTEALNQDDLLFGMENFQKLLKEVSLELDMSRYAKDLLPSPLERLIDIISETLKTFRGETPQSDDITLLAFRGRGILKN